MVYTTATYDGWSAWEDRDPNRRFDQDNAVFATSYKSLPTGSPKLLRGYIRSANPQAFGEGRFFFQFNPNTLARVSQAQYDVYNAQSTSPADLQATNTVGFSFALILDRQAEVAAGVTLDPRRDPYGAAAADPNVGAVNPAAGILADLRVFDRLTGIGTVADTSVPASTINQATFLAKPVRIIFSQALMVEGFMEQVHVTMQKFNHRMIPVYATLQATILARYIGAATRNTGIDYSQLGNATGVAVGGYAGSVGPSGGYAVAPDTRGQPTVAVPTQRPPRIKVI